MEVSTGAKYKQTRTHKHTHIHSCASWHTIIQLTVASNICFRSASLFRGAVRHSTCCIGNRIVYGRVAHVSCHHAEHAELSPRTHTTAEDRCSHVSGQESIQVVCAGARCRSARSKQDTTKLSLLAALARGCAAQGERNTREIRSSYNRARFRSARLYRQPSHCSTDFGVIVLLFCAPIV